jgi:hypothetical protein
MMGFDIFLGTWLGCDILRIGQGPYNYRADIMLLMYMYIKQLPGHKACNTSFLCCSIPMSTLDGVESCAVVACDNRHKEVSFSKISM